MDEQLGAGVARLSWADAHRLELSLRARATRLTGSSGCPGCGRPIEDGDPKLTLAGVTVHPSCLCNCTKPPAAA